MQMAVLSSRGNFYHFKSFCFCKGKKMGHVPLLFFFFKRGESICFLIWNGVLMVLSPENCCTRLNCRKCIYLQAFWYILLWLRELVVYYISLPFQDNTVHIPWKSISWASFTRLPCFLCLYYWFRGNHLVNIEWSPKWEGGNIRK